MSDHDAANHDVPNQDAANYSAAKSGNNASTKRRRLGKGLTGLIGQPVAVGTSAVETPMKQSTAHNGQPPSQDREAGRAADATVGISHDPSAPGDADSPKTDIRANEPASSDDAIISLAVSALIPNRNQPRQEFDADGLRELSESIRREGVMQPVLVRPGSGSGSTGGRYELIAGERRWRAAKLAGLTIVPAIVRELSDEKSAEWALIENLHRQDLNAMERAEAMSSLMSRFGLTQTELAERLGVERSSLANLVRLLELEAEIRALIARDALGLGHGKALLSAPAGEGRVDLARAAAAGAWSVRKLEAEAKRAKQANAGTSPKRAAGPSIGSQRSAVVADLEKRLGEKLGTRVNIRTNPAGTKGKIEIAFYGLDHFDGLVESIAGPVS